MSALAWDKTVAALGFMLLFLFLLFAQAVVASHDTELNLCLTQDTSFFEIFTMVYEVCDVQQLLIKLLISHQLLQSNKIPIFETTLQILVDFQRINVFNKCEVFPWNAVLNAWWSYQALI